MKKIIILLSFSIYLLVIFSNLNKTNKYENIITGLLIFDILLIFFTIIIYLKKNEKNTIK